jgi:DeoR family deoxyribose operon repressor
MNDKEKRIEQIVDMLKSETAVSVRELADTLDVSEMTVRRYLNDLSERGMVTLLHGGAVLNQESYYESYERRYLLSTEGTKHREEKRRIGTAAAKLIEENDIVIVDSGSTTEWLAKSFPEGYKVRALCYALNILIELHRKELCEILFAGGELHRNTLMFESGEALKMIGRFRGRKAFFSASGIHGELGVTSANEYETEMKQASLGSSLEKILLADSSKFGMVSSSYYADLADFDTIITDSGVPEEYRELVGNLGIELIVV